MPTPLPPPRTLRVFPHRGAIDHGLALRPGDAVAADGLFTFETLFLALPPPAGRRYVLPLASQLLLRGLMAEAGGRLSRLATDPPSVRAHLAALKELRLAGISAGHLRQGSPRLLELAGLLGAYERALDGLGFFDDADRQRAGVLAVAEGRGGPAFAGAERLVVEGGANLFGSRLDLLRAAAARGLEVVVRLPWDAARRAAFAWPEASLHRLEDAQHARITPELDDLVGEGPLAPLRRAQLGGGVAPGAPARLLEVPSATEHAAAAAAQVARWLRQGIPAHRIAVVAAHPELGADVTRELRTLGVSAYGGRAPALARSTPARALLLALELPLWGFPREALIDLLLMLDRQVEVPDGVSWSAEYLARQLRQAGVRSQRVGGYQAALSRLGERESTRGDRRPQFAAAADHVQALLSRLEAVPARATLTEAVEAVEALRRGLALDALGGSRSPWQPEDIHTQAALLSAEAGVDEAAALVTEVLLSLRQAARVVPATGPKVTRHELHALLRQLFFERSLSPPGTRACSVQVLSPQEVVGTRFSRLLFAGVDPDVFPRLPPADVVLTDELRAEIHRQLGPRLLQYGALTGRGVLRGEARDGWLWLEALRACEDELCVSYTRPEGKQGRSELVDELWRSLGAPEPERWTPSYAGGDSGAVVQLRQRWVRGRYQPRARVHPVDPPALVSALGEALSKKDAAAFGSLSQRVEAELAVTGPARSWQPLGGDERQLLAGRYFDEVLSASRLDSLGMCAYRHFAQAMLGLTGEDVGTLGASPREEGSAAHAALHVVYRDLVSRGGLEAARQDPKATWQRARQVFEASADEVLREVVVHPLLRPATLENAWVAVVTQLESDLRGDSGLEPLALEYRFDDRPPKDGTAELLVLDDPTGRGQLRVRGGVDRIDRGAGVLAALDYKRTVAARAEGRHFQLPLYLMVALRDFGEGVEQVRADWVALRDAKRKPAVEAGSQPQAFTAAALGDLWRRIDRVLGGDVSPDPDPPELCRSCDIRPVCRFSAVDTDDEAKS